MYTHVGFSVAGPCLKIFYSTGEVFDLGQWSRAMGVTTITLIKGE